MTTTRPPRTGGPIRAVIVTNIPTPYRMPVYELLGRREIALHVVYLAEREPNRHWTLPPTRVRSTVLPSTQLTWRGRYIHFTRGVLPLLARLRPDVVVTTGFNPPQLLAVAYCLLARVPHVVQTDGSLRSEASLTRLHRLVRRLVTRRSAAFVAASESGMRLVEGWGAPAAAVVQSPLAVDNDAFTVPADRDIDLLFSGQLSAVKDPLFALEVAAGAARRLGRRLTIAFVGTGPLLDALTEAARGRTDLDVEIAGFQQQADLPRWYARSKVFLFPTHWDPWGLVSNEAAAAGLPQIVSTEAGSAGELVRDGHEGFVLPLEAEAWIEAAVRLLDDAPLRERLGAAGRSRVRHYSRSAAADGLRRAILLAARA